MNNDEDISQQPGVETDVSADETKKNALAEASMKARQLKSDRKRARAEIARFLRQKKREKADKKVVEEEVGSDEKEEEEEVKRQTRSRFKIEDAKQKSKFNEPKAAENVEKPEKMKSLAKRMHEALAKKRAKKAKRVENLRLVREKFLNRNRKPPFNFPFKKREFPLIRPEKDEEWTLESERMGIKKKQKPKNAKINQIDDYNMEEMVEEVEAEEPDAITQIKTDPEQQKPVEALDVKLEPIEMDYSEVGESSSSNQMISVKIENFEPVRSDITIKQEEASSSDF
ncbi:hypothetical protein GCK72_007446 [Caenorhabditis remanei]|uniref:Uncharacterized protein n=1 Tax=Caenorhabditis remanei TaxID=31234 RepID=A0A6A5HM21_CAERE|nr:hypothetical protein GCK72_007446 [Caenorhabditis remanei]KAF1767487.1 hypothetical protein GCK72_007446 [Caenorhabditis remanei]